MVRILNNSGSVTISSEVFTNIAGDAATKCFGVKGMVGKAKENGLYQLLRRESMSKGVSVTFHEEGAVSIALHIAVDYGLNISVLVGSIIHEVSYKVSEATGVPVRSVDVYVDSIIAG
ncbi:MAG: Asp23/Gls24 family envelope stress response protein [Ruminococcaceae bacterium]|nr:Asp23/Gls24 family envelope stress response protein [Oscillospiraceae bacterium]